MKDEHGVKRTFVAILGNVVLVLLGLAIALVSMELLLRAFPNLIPGDVRTDPPVRRVQAVSDQTYEVKLSSGDLFYWMRGAIAPVPEDEDKVVADVHFTTDANGFRNDPSESDTYTIVALGDSFTVAGNVDSPWPQALAEYSGSAVLNLGEAGNGPQQELKILRRYGLPASPQWVILAYFEGNDLYDAASYAQASPFILPRFGKYVAERGLEALQDGQPTNVNARVDRDYRYPITLTAGHGDLEMAFFSYYFAWLSVDRESIEASQNFELVKETLLQARDLSEESEARFLLVYVPTKEHVYLPYLNDAELRARVFVDVPMMGLDEAGFLQFTDKHVTPELILQHSDDQSELLADFAAQHNIHYLDLTPAFQAEAGSGKELYYPFDTHWNQLGHNLAANTIHEYINENAPDSQ